jgi:hypothetical protein
VPMRVVPAPRTLLKSSHSQSLLSQSNQFILKIIKLPL